MASRTVPARTPADALRSLQHQAYEPARDNAAVPAGEASSPTYIGAGSLRPFVPLPGRGGARNRKGRVSYALSLRQAAEMIEATAFAVEVGMPFNRFTTIHWDAAGVRDPLKATGRFLKLLGDAVRAAGSSYAYVWVRENGPGKGEHVHIAWHGPADLPVLKRRVRIWLKLCGCRSRRGICKTETINRSLCSAFIGDAAYRANLSEVLTYQLKGAEPEAQKALDIARADAGGLIIGKRYGTSANIGKSARLAAAGSR